MLNKKRAQRYLASEVSNVFEFTLNRYEYLDDPTWARLAYEEKINPWLRKLEMKHGNKVGIATMVTESTESLATPNELHFKCWVTRLYPEGSTPGRKTYAFAGPSAEGLRQAFER